MSLALVLGCGASGIAAAEYLALRGFDVTVADTRESPGGLIALRERVPAARFVGGEPSLELLSGVGLVVISPGLSPEFSAVAPLVRQAKAGGLEVIGEIELFARELERLKADRGYEPKVIGITGTNGKTTTTTIVGRMVQAAGKSVCVAGNIGPNAITELIRHDAEGTLPEVWVLELSSFQLETTFSLRCDAAAFLNLTQDHIDWHGSLEAYEAAKARIFTERTVRVVNRDDASGVRVIESAQGRCESFGESKPVEPGQWGIASDESFQWLARMPYVEPMGTRKQRLLAIEPELELMMPVHALKLRGRHNAMNALAALALVTAVDMPLASALRVLTTYTGEAHRVQHVLTHRGIEFIDDSKGTNVGATIAALVGLGRNGQKSSVILGGDGKGQEFASIVPAIATYARHVVLIGRDAELIRQALTGVDVPIVSCGTDFDRAVDTAYAAARSGDAVLLSPACASWDMFTSYAQRAERFVQRAHHIVETSGSDQ